MKILLTGASGQAGRALRTRAPTEAVVEATTRETLDLSNPHAIRAAIEAARPDFVINAAAYTDVEAAESSPETAHAINATGAGLLAEAAAAAGARMVHISTDYVFSGEQPRALAVDDATHPLNAYGASKLAGEHAVSSALGDRCCVVRTSWLYYQRGRNFVHTMLRLMNEHDAVTVIHDQFGAPCWADSLAKAVWTAVTEEVSGVHHWRDDGVASWFDFAVAIAEIGSELGLVRSAVDVVPVSSDEYPTKAVRPAFSLLDIESTVQALGMRPGHWRANLRTMLQQLDP